MQGQIVNDVPKMLKKEEDTSEQQQRRAKSVAPQQLKVRSQHAFFSKQK